FKSLPFRERGLKLFQNSSELRRTIVAPFSGAWIEILISSAGVLVNPVAPFSGAWIEIRTLLLWE
ncbi:MAG: hypothetical protein IJT20_01145, partial [Synergistaceae bacterium]|nr:hypothetical protein [Synergistaceae bacterium]